MYNVVFLDELARESHPLANRVYKMVALRNWRREQLIAEEENNSEIMSHMETIRKRIMEN